jgi:hypothetical protein
MALAVWRRIAPSGTGFFHRRSLVRKHGASSPSAKKERRKYKEVNQGSIRKLLSASPKSIELFLKIISKGDFIK